MLQTQDELNKHKYPDWREHSFDWDTAILVESAELIDHFAWKWWKDGAVDNLPQAQMEAVDIWHFLLSKILERITGYDHPLIEAVAMQLSYLSSDTPSGNMHDVVDNTKLFVRTCMLSDNYTSVLGAVQCFCNILLSLGISYETLYCKYVAKTVLNKFRWDNGYGTTYLKDWLGQEDNEYLMQILPKITAESGEGETAELPKKLYSALSNRYQEVKQTSLAM